MNPIEKSSGSEDKKKFKIPKPIKVVLEILIFVFVIWLLHQKLKGYHFEELAKDVAQTPVGKIVLSVFLTFINYLVIPGYDMGAVYYLKHPVKLIKSGVASAVSHALGSLIGNPALTGGSLRFRLYSSWGLTAGEIAKVVTFTFMASSIGLIATAGFLFYFFPTPIPEMFQAGMFKTTKLLGAIFLLILAGYFLAVILRKGKPFTFKGRTLEFPDLNFSLLQVVVGALDWLLAAGVFYALLPDLTRGSYEHILVIYVFAQIAGIISHIPGGLGVFEAVMLAFLGASVGSQNLVAALVVYRGIYYLLPLLIGSVFYIYHELSVKKNFLSRH